MNWRLALWIKPCSAINALYQVPRWAVQCCNFDRSPAGQLEAQFSLDCCSPRLGSDLWARIQLAGGDSKAVINHKGVETEDEAFTSFDFEWPLFHCINPQCLYWPLLDFCELWRVRASFTSCQWSCLGSPLILALIGWRLGLISLGYFRVKC